MEVLNAPATLAYDVHDGNVADSSDFTSNSEPSAPSASSTVTQVEDASDLEAAASCRSVDKEAEEVHSTAQSRRTVRFCAQEHLRAEEPSEVEIIKERFARLLLGEDMSGGRKGVVTALAISNAITNLSASVFGSLWRLEPLAPSKRRMWKREMDWLLCVTDHIVELVPTWQAYPDGGSVEVMVAHPRPDLHINLPALRKLDMMLLECLDTFQSPEFWYVEQEHTVCCKETSSNRSISRHEGKWWLPVPKVPSNGLSEESKRTLLQQKESTSQIFKAATAINGQVLSEMEVPEAYLEGLPKNGKVILGDLYRTLSVEEFSPETVLSTLDLSNEYDVVQLANRIEASILIWHHKLQTKQQMQQPSSREAKFMSRASWGMVRELVADSEKREVLVERAERLLASLRQKFTCMPQSLLDMQKIQYNKDVGQAILESYSRVLESLAFSIISRIDDVLIADEVASGTCSTTTTGTSVSMDSSSSQGLSITRSSTASSIDSPSLTKEPSRRQKTLLFGPGKTLADYMKLDPFSKRVYAAAAAAVATAEGTQQQQQQQWPCRLEQSPLARH